MPFPFFILTFAPKASPQTGEQLPQRGQENDGKNTLIRLFPQDMKRIVYVLMALIGLTAIGCNRQQTYDRVLADADSIIEQNTDSAFTMLQTIPDVLDDGDEASRALYAVLMAQAAYKLYKPVPHDSLMLKATRFYEHNKNTRMLYRGYYYRAMPLYEQGRHDDALLLLKKGEELATKTHDVLYMSKYHESLCMVNDRAGCYNLMLHYARLFHADAIKTKDTVLISRGLSHIFGAYTFLKQYSLAKENILKVIPYLTSLDSIEKSYILTNIGCSYHKYGDFQNAKHYLALSLRCYPKYNTYAELGDVYADEGNFKEAEECWQKALSSENSRIVLNTLTSIYKRYRNQGNHSKALDVLEQISHFKDSLSEVSEKKAILEIQEKYDKQAIENKYYKAQTWIWRCIFMAFAVVILILYLYRRSVKAYTTKLNKSNQTIHKIQQQITRLEDERDRKIAEIDAEKELHGKEVASISQKYDKRIERLKDKIDSVQHEAYERIGHGRDIYRSAMRNMPIRLRDDEKCLIEYYSVFHYATYQKWMEEYEDLSVRYLVILILQELGKKDSEIEQLLIVSPGALRTAKSRINAKKKS